MVALGAIISCFSMGKAAARDPPLALSKAIEAVLQQAADDVSEQFNCSVAIGFDNNSTDPPTSVAAGFSDISGRRLTAPTDRFVWGSVTKCVTAASVLTLVGDGKIQVSDLASKYIDPFLQKIAQNAADKRYMNYTSMTDLFGPVAANITIEGLGRMQQCLPDFDTANPGRGGQPSVDPFREELYRNPSHEYGPLEILSFPWVYEGAKTPQPHRGYSSTNFLLLGLVLASFTDVSSWEEFRQSKYIPAEVLAKLQSVTFGSEGVPANYTHIVGYDRTSYNGHSPTTSTPVSSVAGVFAGWTASDYIADVADTASMTSAIYGTTRFVPTDELREYMRPGGREFYGFGTFNLSTTTGIAAPKGTAYGHLGATYGFQSQNTYYPHYGFSLAAATNIETDEQSQPALAMCKAFHGVRALLEGRPVPRWCNLTAHASFFMKPCVCSDFPPTPPPTPPPPSPYGPQCDAYKVRPGDCYDGKPTKAQTEHDVSGCCALASQAHSSLFNYHKLNKSCELIGDYTGTHPCIAGLLGYMHP